LAKEALHVIICPVNPWGWGIFRDFGFHVQVRFTVAKAETMKEVVDNDNDKHRAGMQSNGPSASGVYQVHQSLLYRLKPVPWPSSLATGE
jgi:hypothetical protein